jgi:hypothetical protein
MLPRWDVYGFLGIGIDQIVSVTIMASLLINGEIHGEKTPTKYKSIKLIMQKLANPHSIWLH